MRDAPMIAAALVALSACQAPRVPATRAAPAVAPSPVAAAEPSAVGPADPPGQAASPPADLLRCALDATVYELGEPGDDEPSAPVIVGDDVVVGFTRSAADGSALWVQRAHVAGGLEAAVRVRAGVHASRPPIAGDGARGVVVAVEPGGRSEVIALDALDRPGVALDHPPDDVALGPRGVVLTYTDGTRRVVGREGLPDVTLPRPRSFSMPREQVLASGPSADVVLTRHGRAAQLATLSGPSVARSAVLFRAAREGFAEASVAAGPSGFALAHTGPAIADLQVFLADASGAVGAPVAIPAPATSSRPPDALVRRYPRVAAVGPGWAVSYWDGTGPSLVRIDASGALVGDAIELRSGDERGGHTDARMAASADAIAVTWQVAPPRFGHGFPEEEPRRPGPRLAVLRCAP